MRQRLCISFMCFAQCIQLIVASKSKVKEVGQEGR